MNIFETHNYKKFVNFWVRSQPKAGYGQYRKIAEFINTGTVFVSQVFKGDRHLSFEQAYSLIEFMNLTELEGEYFHLLVQYAKAGSQKYQNFLNKKINEVKKRSQNLKDRIAQDIELDEKAKAVFYSNWHYSAIRNLSAIKGFNTIDAVGDRLGISKKKVKEAVEFLVKNSLLKLEAGEIKSGPKKTHLEANSYLIKNRQIQWRLRGFEKMDDLLDDELFYTAPMSLSKKAIVEIRDELLKTVQRVVATVEQSDSEEVMCLNIDWFRF